MSLPIYFISAIFTFSFLPFVCPNCIFQGGKYNLSSLDWPEGWPVAANSSTKFIISLCRPLNYTSPSGQTDCVNSSICKISGNNAISYANAIQSEKDFVLADSSVVGSAFSLFITSKKACNKNGNVRASINFECGSTLGSPEIVLYNDCQVNFIWRTSAACPDKPKRHEVPCYVIDEEGQKRDLSYLIKKEGGHLVATEDPHFEFFINVCSNIVPSQDGTKNCSLNSSTCGNYHGEQSALGELSGRLHLGQEGLELSYETGNEAFVPGRPFCQLNPKTKIIFKCPSRGLSQQPKLITNAHNYRICQYEIIWYTEHACPESSLKGSSKTCKFTQDLHGVEIDLSPLKMQPVYNISASINGSEIIFSLSVCQGLEAVVCGGTGSKSNSVCMTNSSSGLSEVIGTRAISKLKYVDQQVMLIYPDGKECSMGMKQTSVINFICNRSVNGTGKPQHMSSEDCFHIFNWETEHACLKKPIENWCSVVVNNTRIDLEKLRITEGRPWEVVDPGSTRKEKGGLFLNVCDRVSNFDNLSKCGENSSFCLQKDDGEYLNLGQFMAAPKYDQNSKSVILEYYGGSYCGNGQWKAIITFKCRPGLVNSEPVLMSIDILDCIYIIEWHTAVACPEVINEGSNCMIRDLNSGAIFDLSVLKTKTYEVTKNSRKFYLGICGSVKSPCSSLNSSQIVSACMVENSTESNPKIIGKANATLFYSNGVINLEYFSSEKYDNRNSSYQTSITFICDATAGNGNPVFVEQEKSILKFHWYTNLVCLNSAPMECLVHDPLSHLVYDLSELSTSQQNWVVRNGKNRIYLNICRSLAAPVICDPSAAACIVEGEIGKEKVVISNIGRISKPPELISPGHLTLVYTNGEPCTAFGEKTNYTTIIHFLCADKEKMSSGPMFLNQVGQCQYTFLWTTTAACPTGNFLSKNSCQLTIPESGFTFDLTSLTLQGHKKPYTATTGSRTFELNVCGSVGDGCHSGNVSVSSQDIGACETKNNTLISVLGDVKDYTLSYSQGEDLSLSYKHIANTPNETKEVHIAFPCRDSAKDTPELKFIEENPFGKYYFEMETSLSCIPVHFDCSFSNPTNGDEYDLSPLSRYSHGNWEVSDRQVNGTIYKYHINFCRPLNKDLSYNCPGGTSSACQTDTANPLAHGINLGSQQAQPTVTSGGIVTVKYTEGSFCSNGQFKYSTTINLFCSHIEGELKFVGETPECEYIFSLLSPVACPVQVNKGSNCKVIDPAFGYVFDLSQLQKKGSNYNITVGEYMYSFNVCGKLNGLPSKCENAGICQTKPSDPSFSKSLGSPNSNLTYRKGVITLMYDQGTGSCHKKFNRSSKITFTCDHAYEDKDGPIFISEAEDCTYLFEWPTVHACPPFDVIECSVSDNKGNYYDLSKLSLSNDNYYLKHPTSDNKTFAINLCRSIVPTPNSLCSYSAASCLVDTTKPLESVTLGRVGRGLYFEDGHIKINYTTGDPCNIGKISSARFMQTVIEFTCDKTKIDSEPEFIGKDGCTYYFDWSTVYACIPETPIFTGNCKAEDNVRGYVYDLSPLKNRSSVVQHASHKFYINICDGYGDNPCHNHSGMCQEEISGTKRHWNGGIKNGDLQFNDGILFLNYSNGDSCHNGKFQRNTIIQFQCGKGVGEPVFIYESLDCTYFFIWETELACEPFIHCAIRNGSHYYDFSDLSESYFVAGSSLANDSSTYYISVCGSLPPLNGIYCPDGAAICRLTDSQKGAVKITTAQSLGRVEHLPFIDFEGYPTAIYTNGSVCPTSPNDQNRARIIFLCQPEPGLLGEPVLIDKTEDCFYLFEWKTSIVCPDLPTKQSATSCEYIDESKGLHFDLSSVQRNGSYYTASDNPNKADQLFLLNVCDTVNSSNLTACKNSGVCLQEGKIAHNYGLASTLKFSYDGSRLMMSLFDGDDCPSGINGKRSSSIFFICDPSAGIGKPQVYKKYTCMVVFMWKTNLVCHNTHHQCSFDVGGNHYDLSLLSSLSHNWNATDTNKNVYWINLCRGIVSTDESKGCVGTPAVCLKDENGSHMSLGLVQTMQVKANNSDLLLTFGSGDRGACTSINSTTLLWATTRIVMRCSHNIGSPKFLSGPDTECFYDFLWETSLACPEKTVEVMIESNGTLYDSRFQHAMDLTDILNHSFSVVEKTREENYIYQINLSKVFQNSTDPNSTCAEAAVCQTKPGSSFQRDIGSYDTRRFFIRGSELHLVLTSRSGPCGKTKIKNVTTIFNMACSSAAGIGTPKFLYESGICDYFFEWETIAVCPQYHRVKPSGEPPGGEPENVHYKDVAKSSHATEAVICAVIFVVIISGLIFILVNPHRRSAVALRFRGMFGRVHLPHFQYKRCENERLILIDAAQAVHYDNENNKDVELLT